MSLPFWLEAAAGTLREARRQGRFPSSLLIHESPGGGGELLAFEAARIALCRSEDAVWPCGHCRDCRWLAAGTHPDLYHVAPLEDSTQIRIEQVRELIGELGLTSHGAGAAIAILTPAEAMNANAANALLKTLEEPRPGVSLLLVTTTPSRLPATVVSRCQRLRVRPPPRAELLEWLRREHGERAWEDAVDVLGNAPLTILATDAKRLAELRRETFAALEEAVAGALDVTETAARWAREADLPLRLACLARWVDLQLEAHVRGDGHLQPSARPPKLARFLRLAEACRDLVRLLPTAVNRSLALEQLLWAARAR